MKRIIQPGYDGPMPMAIRALAQYGPMTQAQILEAIGPSIPPEHAARNYERTRRAALSHEDKIRIGRRTAVYDACHNLLDKDRAGGILCRLEDNGDGKVYSLTEAAFECFPELTVGAIKNPTLLAAAKAIADAYVPDGNRNGTGIRQALRIIMKLDKEMGHG
jgi:hypothetical protein